VGHMQPSSGVRLGQMPKDLFDGPLIGLSNKFFNIQSVGHMQPSSGVWLGQMPKDLFDGPLRATMADCLGPVILWGMGHWLLI
jgi:hypothetical protein